MDITLYVNNSENRALSKSLSQPLVLSGSLREETSILNPSILFELDYPSTYNYCYIPDFHRYYFISNMTSVRTNLWRIDCSVDVLMSFRDEIMQLSIVTDNSEDSPERYMNGEAWQRLVKTKTDIVSFPSGFNDTGEYILITSGGIPTGTEE